MAVCNTTVYMYACREAQLNRDHTHSQSCPKYAGASISSATIHTHTHTHTHTHNCDTLWLSKAYCKVIGAQGMACFTNKAHKQRQVASVFNTRMASEMRPRCTALDSLMWHTHHVMQQKTKY